MRGASSRTRSRFGWLWLGWAKTLACLALGLAWTAAPAWWLAWTLPDRITPYLPTTEDPRRHMYVQLHAQVFGDRVEALSWPIDVPTDWPVANQGSDFDSAGYRDRQRSSFQPQLNAYMIHQVEAGLPLRSLRWTTVHTPATTDYRRSSFHAGLLIRGIRLPVHPIWPGFAIDVVFWSALPWVSIVVFRVVRVRRRVRRGLCAYCKYEMGELERCPECGA